LEEVLILIYSSFAITSQLSLEQRSDEEALEGLRIKKEELQENQRKLRDDRFVALKAYVQASCFFTSRFL
jgi:hypothetical protein